MMILLQVFAVMMMFAVMMILLQVFAVMMILLQVFAVMMISERLLRIMRMISKFPLMVFMPNNFSEKIEKVISGTLRLQTEFVHYELFLTSTQGAGILLDKKGHLLTNAHIVSSPFNFKVQGGTLAPHWLRASRVLANFEGGEQYEAEILSVDIDKDLALLRVDESAIRPHNIPCAFSKDVPGRGEDFFVVGHPHDLAPFNVKKGHLSNPSRCFPHSLNYIDPAVEFLELDVMAAPGFSGGPLSTAEGLVFGVLHGGIQEIATSYGIPVAIIESFLESNVVI